MGMSWEVLVVPRSAVAAVGRLAPLWHVWLMLTQRTSSCRNGACVSVLGLPKPVPQTRMTYNDGDSLPHSAGGPKPQIEVPAGLPFRASSSLQQWLAALGIPQPADASLGSLSSHGLLPLCASVSLLFL